MSVLNSRRITGTALLLCVGISCCLGKEKSAGESVSLEKYGAVVKLKGGSFVMGDNSEGRDNPLNSSLNTRSATVKPFAMDIFPVTNEHFRKFVRAKKFKSEAERFGWSFVFHDFVPEKIRKTIKQSVQVSRC